MNTSWKYYLTFVITLIFLGDSNAQIIFDTLQLHEFEIIDFHFDKQSATNTSTIDSLQQNELGLVDIGELLSSFSPVFVKSYGKGSMATVSFRGTGASHTKVVWEGFNINSPMLGQIDFSTIPVSLFDKIELQYGGSSLTEVSGALGGSINLKTKSGFIDDKVISLTQSVGSFNTFLTAATLSFVNKTVSSTTNFTRQSSLNDFSYYNNAILPESEYMQQTNANFSNYGFTQQLDFKFNNNQQLTFISWNQWNNRNIPTIMTNVEKAGSQDEYQNDFFSRNIIKWILNTTKTSLNIRGSYFYENLGYYLQTKDTLDNMITQIDSKNKVRSFAASADIATRISEKAMLKAGSRFLNQEVESNNYAESKTRNLVSNYISLSLLIGHKINSEILIRSDFVDGEFTPVMPMIGINYQPINTQDLFFRLNLSRNYNLPSLNDLYWYPGGNDSLLPENSLESEIGIDYSFSIKDNHQITFRSTAYLSSVKNWIIWTPGDHRYWSPQNVANVLSRGLELSLKIIGKISQVNYYISTEYAYTRSTNNSQLAREKGTSEIQLMYVPKNTFNTFLSLSLSDYYINWGLHYTDSRNTSLNNSENYSYNLPSYTLNDISIGKKGILKKFNYNFKFKVYNVFNVNYQAVLWRAMPRRNFEISLNINI